MALVILLEGQDKIFIFMPIIWGTTEICPQNLKDVKLRKFEQE